MKFKKQVTYERTEEDKALIEFVIWSLGGMVMFLALGGLFLITGMYDELVVKVIEFCVGFTGTMAATFGVIALIGILSTRKVRYVKVRR